MTVVLSSIDIEVPPQAVWDYVMDADSTREWVTIVRGIGHVDEGPLREGFRMDQRLCLRGVTFNVHWELDELDAPHFARWVGRGPARAKAIIEDRLTARNGGTHFDYRNEFKAPFGPLGSLAGRALVGGVPETEANASLRQLKQILERR